MNRILTAALNYASQGVKVLPLHYTTDTGVCSCGGEVVNPNCKPGKHPYGKLVPNGLRDASIDPVTLEKWFSGGKLNLGIVTGVESGFFVVDQDDKDAGHLTIQDLEAKHGSLPKTLVQRTGNGRHILFKMPVGLDVKNSQKLVGAGVDVRGTGGYICAAPSKHASGRHYEWVGTCDFDRELIAEAPSWLIQLATANQNKKPLLVVDNDDLIHTQIFTIPEKISDGEGREGFILKYAGHLRGKGLDQPTIERFLLDYNQLHIDPPLDTHIVLDRAQRFEGQQIQAVSEPTGQTLEVMQGNLPAHEEIVDTLPSVPKFNPSLLPNEIAEYAVDIAERMSCPVEFAAVGVISTLAAAIGGRVCIKPYQKNTWMVPGGIWGMIVSPPSAIKSPPLSESIRPLRDQDKKSAAEYRLAMQQYEIDKGIYDKAVKDAIRNGVHNPGLIEPAAPAMKRYVVNDSTYEKLIEIAQANPDGFLVFRDELVGWFHSLSKENQKEARGLYLTGWSGTESYATDRIGRGHVRADRVNLSLLGTIQPNVVRQIVYDAISGGGGDDGLIARFQLAVYPDPVREFKKVDRYPNLKAMQHYEGLVEKMINLDPSSIGVEYDLYGTPYLSFSEDAQPYFDAWRQELEDKLRNPESEEHPAMLSHLGKYRSLVPKMALILHLAAGHTGNVGVNATRRAIAWAKLLEAHARRIYHTATNRTMQSACALSNKIKANRLSNGFTRSDVLTKEWANLRTADEVNSALTVLRDKFWLTALEDRRTGGRPTERFYINPSIKIAA